MWTGRLWKIPTADELAEFAELLVQARKVCSNFRVTRDGKEVVINKYVGKETVVEIPSSILKTPITQIGYKAFKNCTNLTRITIPNSVTSIGDSAFSDCTSLTSIIIPNSVSDIYGAFEGCTKLTSITIGANKYITYAKFPNNFDAYYESQGKKAGTYTWSGRLWSVK